MDRPPPYPSPYGQAPGTPPPPGYAPPGAAPSPDNPYLGPNAGTGYDPRYGYGPPGGPYGAPNGPASSEETTWAMMSYLGMILVSFIAPLVVYFAKRQSPFVRFHAAQALNYILTVLIHVVVVLLVCVPLAVVLDHPAPLVLLIPVYLVDGLGQWVFLILGALKAGKGQMYRFPTFFCFRMIR